MCVCVCVCTFPPGKTHSSSYDAYKAAKDSSKSGRLAVYTEVEEKATAEIKPERVIDLPESMRRMNWVNVSSLTEKHGEGMNLCLILFWTPTEVLRVDSGQVLEADWTCLHHALVCCEATLWLRHFSANCVCVLHVKGWYRGWAICQTIWVCRVLLCLPRGK